MTYVVTEACINCKYQDCIEVCPVDAIIPDTDPAAEKWIAINQKYAEQWPNIAEKGTPPSEADGWADKDGKLAFLSEKPASA